MTIVEKKLVVNEILKGLMDHFSIKVSGSGTNKKPMKIILFGKAYGDGGGEYFTVRNGKIINRDVCGRFTNKMNGSFRSFVEQLIKFNLKNFDFSLEMD